MRQQTKKFIGIWVLASLAGAGLFLAGVLRNGTLDYWYLLFNLLLGVIPLGAAVWLRFSVDTKGWRKWHISLLGALWLLFLPNSFYIVTDFIHLPEVARVDVVQDAVMLMHFSALGLVAGFISLYIMHGLLLGRYSHRVAMMLILGVIYLASFAIYLGRELRWNSWDIILHPFSVIKDTLLLWWHPVYGVSAIWMTLSFFVMLTTLYLLLWYGLEMAQHSSSARIDVK